MLFPPLFPAQQGSPPNQRRPRPPAGEVAKRPHSTRRDPPLPPGEDLAANSLPDMIKDTFSGRSEKVIRQAETLPGTIRTNTRGALWPPFATFQEE